jgi:hypothetical protein
LTPKHLQIAHAIVGSFSAHWLSVLVAALAVLAAVILHWA